MVSILGRSPRRPFRPVPHDGPAHSQRQRQEEQIGGIEGRRGSYGVKAAQRADKALRGETEVEQHQCKDAAQRTAQCKGRAHLVQPFPHLFRRLGLFFLFDRRFLDGCSLRSSRGSTRPLRPAVQALPPSAAPPEPPRRRRSGT